MLRFQTSHTQFPLPPPFESTHDILKRIKCHALPQIFFLKRIYRDMNEIYGKKKTQDIKAFFYINI